ncbi:MAG: 3-dehydroquinate synthase [Alphaproteobacteria bacterium]|nr:3-dehydroquinate synthase [Alphaproteobacteria bacterium]
MNALAETARFVSGKILRVDIPPSGATAYDIVIGHSILAEIGTLLRLRLGARRCVIVTDSNVEPLYRARCEARLAASGHEVVGCVTLPAGEASKDFAHLQKTLKQILGFGIDRQSILVALGGGVVGDMTGLAGALALRGVGVVQVPTTLLAQVDSSVGGKTGIDTGYGKNTVGAFSQPKLVVADVALLDSLPEREMRAGYAEIVKYGIIRDEAFFRWCLGHGGKLLNGDHGAQVQAIEASCAAKAAIVAADEREAGERALLNFGHTFGHAMEAAMGFGGRLNHGEAVAVGMILAMRLSARLGLCSPDDSDAVRMHLADVGLPVSPPPFSWNVDELMRFMTQDKKAESGRLTLILSRGIGKAFVARDVDPAPVRQLWEEVLPR